MAEFKDYIKDVNINACSKEVTLTMAEYVSENDIIVFPAGTVFVSSVTTGNFTPVDNILTLNNISENDTVTMLCPSIGPYLIEYTDVTGSSKTYYEPIYFDCDTEGTPCDCNDNGGCSCSSIRNDDKNIVSKSLYGVLSRFEYLQTEAFSKEYAIELKYNESENKLILNDNRINYDGNSVTPILVDKYHKKVLMTYLSYDKFNAKFIEQIVMSHLTDSDIHEWGMPIGSFDCFYHNEDDCVIAESDFTHATVFVEYLTGNGGYLATTNHYPIRYERQVNMEDGKPKKDGLYKSYFFMIPDFDIAFNDALNNSIAVPNTEFFIYTDTEGNDHNLKFNNSILTYASSTDFVVENTFTGDIIHYDLTDDEVLLSFLNTYIIDNDMDLLKNLGSLDNMLHLAPYETLRTIYTEDMHLFTYDLRDMIVESILDCEIPCEKFSFDEWMAMMQKKKAAKIHFCNSNITEVVRIMFTLEERCKNC